MIFIYARPLYHNEFQGRQRTLRRIIGRAKTQQNSIIVGTPHIGKTSLLYFIESKPAQAYWGEAHPRIIFHHLDVHTLLGLQTQAAFWEQVLGTEALLIALGEELPIYERARVNQFGAFVLEQLFRVLHRRGYQLQLLLDEFDNFLAHPILNSAEFYGSLRSLSSRLPSLTLILASRLSIADLNNATQDFAPHGSPYFNTFTEYQLGALTGKDFEALLHPAKFDKAQRLFVQKLSGQHPYLTQLTAASLIDTLPDQLPTTKLYNQASTAAHRQADHFFKDCWRGWKAGERKALTAVGLSQLPHLIPNHTADLRELTHSLDSYTPELERLQPSGIVTYNDDSGWHIRQELFLWWLADDLQRRLRTSGDFDTWLQHHMMDGALTHRENQLFSQATKSMWSLLSKGANSFIEAYATAVANKHA